MDFWNKSARDYQFRKKKDNPSFSSTLLDAIYNSNDQRDCRREEAELRFYREAMRNRQSFDSRKEDENWKSRKLCTGNSWMENTTENVAIRRNSMADFDRKARNIRGRDFKWVTSSSSSSESSSGGGVSSSECESFFARQKLKPIKTTASVRAEKPHSDEANFSVPIEKIAKGTFLKTKSRASKIYDDLKKVKPPISPGGRLSSLLNSLFNGGSPKKPKFSSSNPATQENYPRKPNPSEKTTSSSASTFSMSCLSKTPSSTGKLNRKTVTFDPLSVIVDEDSRPCGHRRICGVEAGQLDRRHFVAEEANRHEVSDGEEDEEEDDVVSCSSSDLFELDNLSGIEGSGSGRRQNQELPVYETTRFGFEPGSFCNKMKDLGHQLATNYC